MNRRGSPRVLVLGMLAVVVVASCRESLSPVDRPLRGAGENGLDHKRLNRLRDFADGGCATVTRDPQGVAKGVAVERSVLPFDVAPITYDPRTGQGNGKVVRMHATLPDGSALEMTCLVPVTETVDGIAKSMQGRKGHRMASLVDRVKRKGRVLPDSATPAALTAEAALVTSQMLQSKPKLSQSPLASLFNWGGGCYDVRADLSYDSADWGWITLSITWTECDGDGGGGGLLPWMIDNGYDDPYYVCLDADKYAITVLDSVAFDATIVSPVHLSTLGWTWRPAISTGWDTLTHECYTTASTCKIQVHGTGRMFFKVLNGSDTLSDDVLITAELPEDVGPDSGDAPLPLNWDSGGTSTTPISATQSTAILVTAFALGTPDWVYTQGCAHCHFSPPNYYEPPVDTANHYGDCTDFVETAVRNTLKSSWVHAKLSTTMFETFDSTALSSHGYLQVATPREGDVVVRAHSSGTDRSGHAGIYIGVGWKTSSTVPHVIGYANNGKPALDNRPNSNLFTSSFDFTPIAGYETKFFRPKT